MSLHKLLSDEIEYFKLETNPIRTYSSSSIDGISGAINLYAMRSTATKELFPLSMFTQSYFTDSDIESYRKTIANNAYTNTNLEGDLDNYLNLVNAQGQSLRQEQQLQIYRFVPPASLNSNTLRKNVVRNILNPYYKNTYSKCHWNYTNYNSLNFFSSSNTSTSSVLIYSNPSWYDPNEYAEPNNGSHLGGTNVYYNSNGFVRSQYQLSGAFTFDFWIKPTQTQEIDELPYIPGTIMHMSSGYAITLHSGSSRDQNGLIDKFRICFQYGVDTKSPSELVHGVNVDDSGTTDSYTVWSSDNAININQWHHVTIKSSTNDVNLVTMYIDSEPNTYFSCSSIINATVGDCALNVGGYNALFVGNFYEGSSDVYEFFPMLSNGDDIQYGGGGRTYLYETSYQKYLETTGSYPALLSAWEATNPAPGPYVPSSFAFNHGLKAELHELKLYDKMLNTKEIEDLQTNGPGYPGRINYSNLRFYLPPFFTYESPIRSNELITPFQTAVSESTNTPFSTRLAYGVYGHSINLENYLRDFACDNYPILYNMIAETTNETTDALAANTFIYNSGSNIKRLYTILPCDNGNIVPNFYFLKDLNTFRFVNDLGNQDLGSISLNNMIGSSNFTASIAFGNITDPSDQTILNNILGATPEEMYLTSGSSLAVLHRTRDTSSNQVVFFDVSNIFYGKHIKPGSIEIKDLALSGPTSNTAIGKGKQNNLGIIIKDDGYGNLYRANAINTSHPTWSSVGNVFYNEGIIVLKFPQLYFFGENQFEISMKGTQNIHVMTLNATAYAGTLVSSSNPSFSSSINQKPNEDLYNEADQTFVYITGINIHDENLNVIMRTNLAQPVQKLSGEKIVFRTRLDW